MTRPIIMSYGLTLAHLASSQAQQTSGTPHALPERAVTALQANKRRQATERLAAGAA